MPDVYVQEIKGATSIPDVELLRHLQSLACAKYKVLKKHPPGRDVHPEDSFTFNSDFSAPLFKIKISTIASRVENADESKETKDRIDEERKYQIDVSLSMDAIHIFFELSNGKGLRCEDNERTTTYGSQRACERCDSTTGPPVCSKPFGH